MTPHVIEHVLGTATPVRRERLRSRRTLARRALSIVATIALAAGAWWAFAPAALGGSTSFAVVDGTSMLPHLRSGDLIVIRSASTYRPGDVVAYHSRLLHSVVLHRIVSIERGHYTFKGDNNTWTDPEKPTRGDLIGKRRLRVPGGGTITSRVGDPKIAGALAFLFCLSLGIGGRPRPQSPR